MAQGNQRSDYKSWTMESQLKLDEIFIEDKSG